LGGGLDVGDTTGSGRIAYLRWYSTTTAVPGSTRPLDSTSNGDMADWEFEGNLLDSSSHALTLSGSATYAPTP
jgi:hypothetical protein